MGFADDSASIATDAAFAAFGTLASYNDVPTLITIIPDLRDPGSLPDDGRPVSGTVSLEVRKSEIAQPAHGDRFTFGGRTVVVTDRPWLIDESGLVWKMWAV